MTTATAPNSRPALVDRRARHLLLWTGPLLVLFARSALAVAAQGPVAAVYAMQESDSAWREAGAWLPVYGTLIDAGCLVLLWRLVRRVGITLVALVGFDRHRLGRDILTGLVLILPCLLFIFGGVAVSSLLVYGSVGGPQFNQPLPFPAALYAVLVWPLVWGFTEQMTYNGYLVPFPGSLRQYRNRRCSGCVLLVPAARIHAADLRSGVHVASAAVIDAEFDLHDLRVSTPPTAFAAGDCALADG